MGHVNRTEPRILLAAPRGFCAGVTRAVVAVERALELFGGPVYVRRQVVHNRHVVERLERLGAVFVEELDEVPEGAPIIFSAHGVAPAVRDAAAKSRLRVVDATCPLVGKVHVEAKRFADAGFDILLIGSPKHDEIVGTAGEAPDWIHVVDGPEGVAAVKVRDPARVAWLSQTTLTVEETMSIVAKLRARFPSLRDPPSDDICYAAQNRQAAVKLIAPRADLVLVVGSPNSHNSNRLVQTAREAGAGDAYLIDGTRGIREAWLEGVFTIGLSAGASTPDVLIDEVLEWLAARGFADVEEIQTAHEGQTFALPHGLRRLLPQG
jgi:4-hydroxy-3-methylbut-2-enyl diphosphate reductase